MAAMTSVANDLYHLNITPFHRENWAGNETGEQALSCSVMAEQKLETQRTNKCPSLTINTAFIW